MSSYFGHVLKYQKNAGNLKIKVQLSPGQTIATNMPTQHIATLVGATCCVRLATLLRHVAACWMLLAQI